MDRLVSVLLLVLIGSVLAVGVVVYRGDARAQDDAEREACLLQAQATASVALLAPPETVDEEGRLDAMRVLGERIDAC
jgi:hypothetical protein